MQRIIGITGIKESGKDLAATYIHQFYKYKIFKFAAPIIEIIIFLLKSAGVSKKNIYKYTTSNKEDIVPEVNASYRMLAKGIGTTWGRDFIKNDIWINIVELASADCKKVVISDLRLDNEAEWIKNKDPKNIIIKLNRNTGNVDDHITEAGINPSYIDYTIDNNGSLGDLYKELDKILKKLGK
jgi:hypothetical protein